jgi:hypothetical protein
MVGRYSAQRVRWHQHVDEARAMTPRPLYGILAGCLRNVRM